MADPAYEQEFVELMDRLTAEVGRLRAELRELRNRKVETAASAGLDDQTRRALRQQVSDQIRRIDRMLGESQ